MPEMNDDDVRTTIREDLTIGFGRPAPTDAEEAPGVLDDEAAERPDRGTTLPPRRREGGDADEDPVELLEDFGVMRSDAAVAMAWRYTGVHEVRFLGLEPTGRTVAVEGITIVTDGPDGPLLTRLIDWHSVYLQIGAARGGHPVTELEGEVEHPDPEQLPNGLTEQQMQELFG